MTPDLDTVAIAPMVRTPSLTRSRVAWLFLWVVPLVVLTIAAFLTPSAEGHGTHTQLGLPPCGFLTVTGLVCPGCGLTTCFAHMANFDVVAAVSAQPMGVMLFFITVAAVPLAFLGMVRGWPVVQTLDRMRVDLWAILMSAVTLLVWGIRIARQLVGDG